MGFEDALRRRLGPLAELVPSRRNRARPPATELWLRRAVGLEVTVRGVRGDRAEAVGTASPEARALSLTREETTQLVGLTAWTVGDAVPVAPARLETWLDHGLLYWSDAHPTRDLPPCPRPSPDDRVTRRHAAWPTPAIESALAIAPMPFMPRDRDLDGAEMVGMRFATLSRGHEILGVTVLDDGALGARFSELLPKLNGLHTKPELTDRGRKGWRERAQLLGWLDALGVLAPAPPERPSSLGPTAATWLGHASVLLTHQGRGLLVDPLFHAASEPPADPHPRPDPRTLPPLDGILITHGDNDHLSPNALAQLPRDVPVYLPSVTPPPPAHQVDMEGVLRVLGFRDLRPMEKFARTMVGAFEVEALPFDGEDWGLEQAQLTYRVEGPELSVFLAADSLGPEATYLHLQKRPVDLAFMGVSGAAEPLVGAPGLGYGNFYEPWIPPEQRSRFVDHTADPAAAAAFCAVFAPRFAFGYAAGAPWMPGTFADEGDHATFAAALRKSGAAIPVDLPLGRPVTRAELLGGSYISP